MLLQRILTAIPLAILAVWAILHQPTEMLMYALLLVSFIAGWEWAQLAGIRAVPLRLANAAVITLLVYLAYHYILHTHWLHYLLLVTNIWWCLVMLRMAMKPPAPASEQFSAFKLLIALITIIPPVLSLLRVHEIGDGPYWLLYMVSLVWIADIGAYFSGRKFGRVKLAPHLSPGKTREGLYGALLLTSLYAVAASRFFGLTPVQIFWLWVVTVFATLISVAGDLFISLLKRERGIKDTGAILPGHGGVLDRIDSITSSAPFFLFMLEFILSHE
ncbi:MAG: phosphatidate cytidylyltransferase [Pseudomonadota bacterium]|nr:phosphatidate cytidylyltransferase [Pseudomonadota bacterium]